MRTEMLKGSLKLSVFTLFGGFTLLLCLIYSGIGVLAAYVIEDQLIDNLITNEADYIEQHFQQHGELPPPRLPHFTLYTSPADTPAAFTATLDGDRRKAELFVTGHQHYHLRELAPETGTILAAEVGSLLTVSNQSGRLLWLLFAAFLCTTGMAVWLAHRLVTASIRPILSLAREVEAQTGSEQPLELTTNTRNDEIGFLARTLQRSLNDLRQAQRREAEFTRDVSHELRTGLAIATNTLTLARNRSLREMELQELRSILATMNRTVSTLLTLARAESFEFSTFNLRALLEQRLLIRPEISDGKNFQLELILPESMSANGNPNLTGLLLDILLDNAIRHASKPVLQVYTLSNALVFENPVDAMFDTEPLFNAGIRGENSEGIGQGLYLARRILAAQRWDFSARCDKGAFSISIFPAQSATGALQISP